MDRETHIQYLKGVGPKLGEVLRRRGVATVGELLEWYPRAYEDRRSARNISSLEPGQIVSLEALVVNVRSLPMGRSRRKIYEVILGDGSGRVACKFFRVPYKGYFERFQAHQKVRVSGKVTHYRGRIEFHHPDLHAIGEEDSVEDELLPLYTETEGLSPTKLRKLVATAIEELIAKPKEFPEVFPDWLMETYNLIPRSEALRLIHNPPAELSQLYLDFKSPAQRRLIFEEFFWLELYMALQKAGLRKDTAPPIATFGLARKLQDSLPFQLTKAQSRVLEEIQADLKRPFPMHRLVQGDVGSGKTMVALLSACAVIESGFQAAFMAPTEILAEQHFKNAKAFLEPFQIRVELLVSALPAAKHREIHERLKNGDIDLLIGTHALIEDKVNFKNLGLAIVDEQHRFGVDQRHRLKKNSSPHFLVMTATPIPRTLAMTVYGDLDVSVIDELPPGRTPIVTRVAFASKRNQVFDFMKDQITKGRQAYVIYPLVAESEKIDLKDALSEFERLKNLYPDVRFGLLHGKMKAQEKDEVMASFRANEFQVLVSTTVVEVGVDVPNSTLMIIEHAERFGLSQLHQLRGRVGRGQHKSYCVLLMGYAVSQESIDRARVIESTSDGFKIAEADLEIRGPGEFLGRRQSGLPGFKLATWFGTLKFYKRLGRRALSWWKRTQNLVPLLISKFAINYN